MWEYWTSKSFVTNEEMIMCKTRVKTPGVKIEAPSEHNFDKVEMTIILQVKFNVRRDHKHDLSRDFMQGMLHGDQSADHIGDKATDRIVGVFELAGFDAQDAECKAQIVESYSEGINIAEAKVSGKAEAEAEGADEDEDDNITEEKESPECPKCKGGMSYTGDSWVCDLVKCDGRTMTKHLM